MTPLLKEFVPVSPPKELHQAARALGICTCAIPRGLLPDDDRPHHPLLHHHEEMLDSLEGEQLLGDNSHLFDSMLEKLGKLGMEGLR